MRRPVVQDQAAVAGANVQQTSLVRAGRQSADEMLHLGQRRGVLQVVIGGDGSKILVGIAGNEVGIDVTFLELNRQVVLEMNDDGMIDGLHRLELEGEQKLRFRSRDPLEHDHLGPVPATARLDLGNDVADLDQRRPGPGRRNEGAHPPECGADAPRR